MLPKDRLVEIRAERKMGIALARKYNATRLLDRLLAKEEYRVIIQHGECVVHHETLLALALGEIGEKKTVEAICESYYGAWAYYGIRGFTLEMQNASTLVYKIAAVGDPKWAYWALHDFHWISSLQKTLLLHSLTSV